jgi:spore maturation protein CgeB
VGVHDAFLESEVLGLRGPGTRVVFWDVDAPATLERVASDPGDPFGPLIPRYDLVFTYGGGPPVVSRYLSLGARRCVPIYNALDPTTHYPAAPDPRFAGDVSFLGNRLPDREARVEEFFLGPATRLPQLSFVLGGSGWEQKRLPPNVRHVGHVYTADHNAFNCSAGAVLNVHRESMARFGHSPATRVFEVAGAGACLISDRFVGVEAFLAPGEEILLARDGAEVVRLLEELDGARARQIGARARGRVLAEHTYAHRAHEVEAALQALEVEAGQAGAEAAHS